MKLETIDHTAKSLSRVTDDLNKENFNKLVTIYAEEIQELEEALLVLAEQKDLDTVTGIWLDYLGKLIGEPRGGRDDEAYRAALKVKIAINTSDGTPDLMMSLIRQYTNSDVVRLREGSIAWGTIFINGDTNLDNTLYQMVEDIKPVSTKWIIETDVDKNALDIAWEQTVQESVQSVINAECGDFGVECGESVANCGDQELKTVSTTVIGYYPPSVNSKNFLAWETVQILTGVDCGEPNMECGEQGAECGNNIIYTETDVTRPLRWEVNENSLVQ